MISFVIPAHNEQRFIGATVDAVRASAEALGERFEIIVVDDDSTDDTAAIAARRGARVVKVKRRQIAAVRNAGAKAADATSQVLIFVDADTRLTPQVLAAAWAQLRRGAIGGGALVRLDTVEGPLANAAMALWNTLPGRLLHWAAGCFVYVRRDAFEAVGGFDETYFAAEEVVLSIALKKRGRFVVVRREVITSSRKVHVHRAVRTHLRTLFAALLSGGRSLQKRDGLELWYSDAQHGPGRS